MTVLRPNDQRLLWFLNRWLGNRHGDQILIAKNGDRMRQIASLFVWGELVIDVLLSTLLDFAQINTTAAIQILRSAEQAFPDRLCCQSTCRGLIPALLIRKSGCDFDRVFLKSAQSCDVIEQSPGSKVRDLSAVLRGPRLSLRKKLGRKRCTIQQTRFTSHDTTRMTSVNDGEQLVGDFAQRGDMFGKLGVGDGLAIVRVEPLDAFTIGVRVP